MHPNTSVYMFILFLLLEVLKKMLTYLTAYILYANVIYIHVYKISGYSQLNYTKWKHLTVNIV